MKLKLSSKFYFLVIVFFVICGYLAYYAITQYLPNNDQVDFWDYYSDLKTGELYIVIGGQRLESDAESRPVLIDGEIYFDVDFVRSYIDNNIFWDVDANRLTITTTTQVIRIEAGEPIYYINNKAEQLNFPIINIDNTAYIPTIFLSEIYDIQIEYNEVYNMIIMDYTTLARTLCTISGKNGKAVDMRYLPNKKSPIQQKLTTNSEVLAYDETGSYTLVRTSDGLLGYVLTKELKIASIIEPIPEKSPPATPISVTGDGKINLLWDQVTTLAASADPAKRNTYLGLDVISPTWFSFDLGLLDGTITSIADQSYVDWAHDNGLQVWALVTDNFNGDVGSFILGNTKHRENAVDQLVSLTDTFGLDGINIDFEMIRKEDAVCYIQFLRELAPFLHQRGVVLSVDMYVPKPYNLYYNRAEVAKAADYIVLMAYDEHYNGSERSGPVASIGFVLDGITETLKEVPKEQIILGMPFYVRVWTESQTSEGTVLTSQAFGMDYARDLFTQNNAEFVWNETTKTYYAEYRGVENGVTFTRKVWLEDERSIEEKLKLAIEYDLAGVASWKKGLEKSIIWELIYSYIKTNT